MMDFLFTVAIVDLVGNGAGNDGAGMSAGGRSPRRLCGGQPEVRAGSDLHIALLSFLIRLPLCTIYAKF